MERVADLGWVGVGVDLAGSVQHFQATLESGSATSTELSADPLAGCFQLSPANSWRRKVNES